jgi:hypothetical protein
MLVTTPPDDVPQAPTAWKKIDALQAGGLGAVKVVAEIR